MNWFQGDVANAIRASKTSNAPLLVFIAGTNPSSQVYLDNLNGLPDLENKTYVALRIEVNSVPHHQLSAIYGTLGVPCILVISPVNGAAIAQFSDPSSISLSLLSLLPEKPMEIKNGNPTIPSVSHGNEDHLATINNIEEPKNSGFQTDPISNFSVNENIKHTNARIQLKLQNGRSEVVLVSAEETLASVRTKASEVFELKGPFDLAIPYPRRVFLREEELSSVETLGLCPASTLLVLCKAGASDLSTVQFTNTLLLYLEPILAFFRNMWQRLTGGGRREPTTPNARIARLKTD